MGGTEEPGNKRDDKGKEETLNERAKRKKKNSMARRGLDVAGGTTVGLAREKRERDKKERRKRHKDMILQNKRDRLLHERNERDKITDRIGQHEVDSRGTQEDIDGLTKLLEAKDEDIRNLEDDFKGEKKERERLDKETYSEQMKRRVRTVKKVGRAGVRGVRGAVISVKFGFIILAVVVVLFFGMMIASSVMMTYILPAGAFVVLTDDEEGPDGGSGSESSGEESTPELIESDEDFMKGATWMIPSVKTIGSPFGPRSRHPVTGEPNRMHNGIDVAAPGGTDILAYQAGKVVRSEYAGGFGNLVVIEHGGGFQTYYAHMQRPGVSVGTEVKSGDRVGPVGTTGSSTGNHLHFEIRKDNGSGEFVPVDPYPYVKGLGAKQ